MRTRVQVTVEFETEQDWEKGGIVPRRLTQAMMLSPILADMKMPRETAIRLIIGRMFDELLTRTAQKLDVTLPEGT